MARLPLVDSQHASEQTASVYRAIKEQLTPSIPQLFLVFGAVPGLLSAVWDDFRAAMGTGALSKAVKEVIALAVSDANGSAHPADFYTVLLQAHGFNAEDVDGLTQQVQEQNPLIDLNALLGYARRLTTAPADVTPDDYQALRSAGLDTAQLLEIVAVIGQADFFGRMASSLDLRPEGLPALAENVALIRRSAQAIAAARIRDELTPVSSEHPMTVYRVTQKEASRLALGPEVFSAMAPKAGWVAAQERLMVALRATEGPPHETRRALSTVVARLLGLPSNSAKPDLPRLLAQLATDITLHPKFVEGAQIDELVEIYDSPAAALGFVALVGWLNYILRVEQAVAPRLGAVHT